MAICLASKMGYVHGNDYIRALLYEPDESDMDVGMSRGERFCCYGRSRRFGNCCESKNGCSMSVEGKWCQGIF